MLQAMWTRNGNQGKQQTTRELKGAFIRKYLAVSEMGSNPSGFLRGLHDCFLHTVFACPIQTDLVAIGIIEIGMPPTPRHHAWQLGDVEALLLEIAAEVIEFPDFQVQTHTVAQNGSFRTRLVQGDRAVAAWCPQARIHWFFLIAEVFDE